MYLGTVSPSGLTRFTIKIACACSLGAKRGEAGDRGVRSVVAEGQSFGTFLITSGPAVFAGPPWTVSTGGLGGLAGGTFPSFGEPNGTVRLVEHLTDAAQLGIAPALAAGATSWPTARRLALEESGREDDRWKILGLRDVQFCSCAAPQIQGAARRSVR